MKQYILIIIVLLMIFLFLKKTIIEKFENNNTIKEIKILGPFNSGTNLTAKLLFNNCLKKNKIIKINDNLQNIWKHDYRIENIEKVVKQNPTVLFICCYRSLNTWLESIKKHSYDIEWNDNNIYSSVVFKKQKYDNSISCKKFNNIIEIYNKYYLTYKKIIEKYNNVIFIDYYKLIDKEHTFNYISKKLNTFSIKIIDKNKLYQVLNEPAKDHGKSVTNFNEAIKKQYNNVLNIKKENINNDIVNFFENDY